MGKQNDPVTIFGQSSEGYAAASALAKNRYPCTIIDENLNMAVDITPEIASAYPTVKDLMESETALGLTPLDAAIGKAKFIFFAPRLRKSGDEGKNDFNSKLKEVARHVAKKSTIINMVPTGLGDNEANVTLLEKMSGLTPQDGFYYFYFPTTPGTATPIIIGSLESKVTKEHEKLLGILGKNIPILPLSISELFHSKYVLAKYVDSASEIEFVKRAGNSSTNTAGNLISQKELFLNDITEYMFDLKAILPTFNTGEPLLYLATGVLKSTEGYLKRLFEQIRNVFKVKELKASKTQVIIVWSIDKYELRGERSAVLSSLIDRLHDYIGDVAAFNPHQPSNEGIDLIAGKARVVVSCSDQDFKTAAKIFRKSDAGTINVKANLFCEFE